MPRKFYRRRRGGKRRRYGKRRFHRKRKGGKPFSLTIRRPSCLPDRLFVKLKYTQLSYHVMNNQTNTSLMFRGNSPYDPDFQLGGHSCLGYDQWASLYHNYRVHKSHIFVRTASVTAPFRMSIVPTSVLDKPSSAMSAFEYPYARNKTIATSLLTDNYVSNTMYTKKIFGVKSIEYQDNTQAQIDTVPLDQWYWKLFFSSSDLVTNTILYVDISVVYWVEFLNRVELTQSGVSNPPHGETGTQDIFITPTYVGSTGSSIGATGNPGMG